MHLSTLLAVSAWCALALPGQDGRNAAAPRPNVVVFLADDLGWSDFGCYGGEIPTPRIDGLAAAGLRFTQFYNTGRCCPTRASLLTGLYPHQAGIGHMTGDQGHPGYRGDLNDECVTIAEVLRPAGYRTYMAGKWHVTKHVGEWTGSDALTSRHNFPTRRGFDRFFGTITGAGSFFQPATLMRDEARIDEFPDGFYYTTALGDEAARFVAEHPGDEPFFLYVAFTAPHWPLHAPPAAVAAQRGRYDDGWDAIRERRLRRQQELGLIGADVELSARDPGARSWETVSSADWDARRMEVYAAQVAEMDRAIGRVVDAIDGRGMLDDTLILVLADNGGCAEEIRGRWSDLIMPARTLDGEPVAHGNDPGVMPGGDATYQSYGLEWANASNTPFRLYKHYVHEGGIASPLVAHWPRGIAARNELRDVPAHLIDIMATCVDVSDAAYPRERAGVAIQPPEGVSLVPLFGGARPDRTLFWEHEGNRAIRRGAWKLVARGDHGPWELFDLDVDRAEVRDLAAAHPDRVAELAAGWDAWAERCRVKPPDRWRPWSAARRFDLDAATDLARHDAPNVVGRGFRATLELERAGDGVVIAHGGSSHGWALWIEGGRLRFAVCRDGRRTVVDGSETLPEGVLRLALRLAVDGAVTVTHDDRVILDGRVPGPLTAMPVDGLQTGRDAGGSVGSYRSPNPLRGRVLRGLLELDD